MKYLEREIKNLMMTYDDPFEIKEQFIIINQREGFKLTYKNVTKFNNLLDDCAESLTKDLKEDINKFEEFLFEMFRDELHYDVGDRNRVLKRIIEMNDKISFLERYFYRKKV